jgi:ATP synthase protein I
MSIDEDAEFSEQVQNQARRKLAAQRHTAHGIWIGLGMMGLVGWSVVVPTLAGAALGFWIDSHYPGNHSWTLALLVAGLCLGCANAWHWVAKENDAINAAETTQSDPAGEQNE